jgi:hypothetical protein
VIRENGGLIWADILASAEDDIGPKDCAAAAFLGSAGAPDQVNQAVGA